MNTNKTYKYRTSVMDLRVGFHVDGYGIVTEAKHREMDQGDVVRVTFAGVEKPAYLWGDAYVTVLADN